MPHYLTTEAVTASNWLRHNPHVAGRALRTTLASFGLDVAQQQDGCILLTFMDKSQFRSSEPRILRSFGPVQPQEKAKTYVRAPRV